MKEKILIAISDVFLVNLLSQKLKEEGYKVSVARDGREAIEKMISIMPDIVLIDVVLSGKNGYEVLKEKNYNNSIMKIPCIIVSNSGTPLRMNEIPSTPTIKDYIVKTHIEPNEVIEKIGKAFGRVVDTENPKVKLSGTGKKILWVEDDKFLGKILSKKFEATGYTLFKAENGEQTFKILETNTPDIIILDLLVPGMSGFDILQKIKMNEKLKKISVMILSNLSKQSDIDKAKLLGANKFIVKAAVSLEEIIREVELLLNAKK